MFNVGPGELVAILALALIVLGPQRLPEAVRTVGRVVGELRRISSGFQEELRNALDDSEVERDLDRLRAAGDGRDGEGQRELPLDDQPELPLGVVQYPAGFEPIDVKPDDTTTTTPAAATGDGAKVEAEAEADEAAAGNDPLAAAPAAGEPVPAPLDLVDIGDVDEPGKNPAIDDDPDEPWEPPADGEGNGDGRRAVS